MSQTLRVVNKNLDLQKNSLSRKNGRGRYENDDGGAYLPSLGG